jgi:O-methyltransferase involved in polyketide biosynthesis
MLVPLYCRTVETRKKRPILKNPKAVEMVASICLNLLVQIRRR